MTHGYCVPIRVSPVDPRRHLTFGGIGLALIELGRFDEAIVAAKKALRQTPSFSPAYRCLASAFAQLGRDAEAREAAAHVLETDPAFTISGWIARGGQSNSHLQIEGLRKAGLPERTRCATSFSVVSARSCEPRWRLTALSSNFEVGSPEHSRTVGQTKEDPFSPSGQRSPTNQP